MHSYNFKIYDWNMVTSDGLHANASPNQLYRDISENTPDLYFPIKK
ncbi:hypothetical protein LGL55_09640 [Clostridium tagluense]|nr:hypothetical protein [Clostridium tagluense]MCB2364480.1 hypothetical protein [Clostridium tagluense]